MAVGAEVEVAARAVYCIVEALADRGIQTEKSVLTLIGRHQVVRLVVKTDRASTSYTLTPVAAAKAPNYYSELDRAVIPAAGWALGQVVIHLGYWETYLSLLNHNRDDFRKLYYNRNMQEAKEEVRSKLIIEDVIGEYVQLKRAGRLWRGLSPFTNEKTPSFFVTPDRNIWHDFSSNRGGDIFAFIMEVEGLDFRGALEFLARKAGVDLAQYDTHRSREFTDRKKRFLEINSIAMRYFQNALIKSKTAVGYVFSSRGLTKQTVVEWGIGFAPDSGGVVNYLRRKGFRDDEIRGTGLIGGRGGDMFRGRMMVPLCDSQGQVVGFTGRIIGDGEPKYINTPATILYDKGRQVFGLHLAKKSIREQDFAVLVEGNLDVISSHQAGVKNVVACAGTALTHDHLKSLARLTNSVRLCFDGDAAGVAATERAIELAESLGLKLSVIVMPADVKDPDELITGESAKAWCETIDHHKPAVQWIIDTYAAENDLTSADGKKTLTSQALKVIAKLTDPIEREHYLHELSRLTGASHSALEQKMSSGDEPKQMRRLKPTKLTKSDAASRRDEQYLLNRIFAISFASTNLRSILKNLPDTYLTEVLARAKYHMLGEQSIEMTTDLADKLAEFELIASQEISSQTDARSLMLGYMREIELAQAEKNRAKLMNEFATADDGDEQRRTILNGAIKSLNQTIKTLRATGANDDWAGLFSVWEGKIVTR